MHSRPALSATLCLLGGCSSVVEPVAGSQPAVQAWLVLHVDPLSREGDVDCEVTGLTQCGTPVAESFVQRTENLEWLTQTWLAEGRTADVQLGPELSLAWAGDSQVIAAMAAGMDAPEGEAALAEVAGRGRDALASLVDGGLGVLGVHVHTVLPDAQGVWGSAPTTDNGPHPCEAWEEDPFQGWEPAVEEELVHYGAASADRLLQELGGDELSTFTGHPPVTMAGKMALVADPDSLDPSTAREFPGSFVPTDLGSAYSECMLQAVDHPPFELWRASPDRALAAGDGPVVVPGERVVGSMAEHLGAPADGSLGAAGRRVIQLLLNWRYSGLGGEDPRPWAFTFHAHLFDIYPGEPPAMAPDGRDLATRYGSSFRADVDGLASMLDDLASSASWGAVTSSDGSVVRWTLPGELNAAGSRFSYAPDDGPADGLVVESYPYLPLVAEGLRDSHLVCTGVVDDALLFGMLRCDEGWSWGGASAGYHCADGEPRWVYALVGPADEDTCVDSPQTAVRVAAADGSAWDEPTSCGGGLLVPPAGLIVDTASVDPAWPDHCQPWN